jgi:hypothetical protein
MLVPSTAAAAVGDYPCDPSGMGGVPAGSMEFWADVVKQSDIVDEALARDDPFAGVAILVLVLYAADPQVALPRIKAGLRS